MKKIKIVSIVFAVMLTFLSCNVIAEEKKEEGVTGNDSTGLEIKKEEEPGEKLEENKEEVNKEPQENKEEVKENKEETKIVDGTLKLSTEAEIEEGKRIARERLNDSQQAWWIFIIAMSVVTIVTLLCFIKVKKK